MTIKEEKTFFCFIDGEPFIYVKEKKVYIPIETKYSYNSLMTYIKSEVTKLKIRPNMFTIWEFTSDFFGTTSYSPKHSKKSKININSFETRFTLEITEFIDKKFKRGLTEEQKKKKKAYEIANKNKFSLADGVLRSIVKGEKKRKNRAN